MGMNKFISILLSSYFCFHVLICHSCLALRLSGNETDRLTLLEIKARITNDPVEDLTSWNETNTRIISKLRIISVLSNKLTGSIPNSFANLSSFELLSATGNDFYGSIPDIFGQLANFKELGLGNNRLSGVIPPSLYDLSSISVIDVQGSKIQGTLLPDLGILFPNLKYFGIGSNQFSGTIPVTLSNASNLDTFSVVNNNIHGKVPSLKNLCKLETINLSYNSLGSGGNGDLSFLCDLTNATQLLRLLIDTNNFGGILPQCIANLSSSLVYLHAEYNKVSGRIPHGIGNLANLESVCFAKNQFSESIPPDVGKLRSFESVYKGVLGQGETTIAVKVFNLIRRGAYKSFISECEVLRNIKHCNLFKGNDQSITCFRELQTFIYSFVKATLPKKVEEVLDPVLVQEKLPRERLDISDAIKDKDAKS
ncbi:probable LRR receptor-like serine/threonine-protein kinase At3g47570 [Malus domestica]|uniref:probable LRR receptor-like serine/threonine-protein kinase At3g47570 n=1 Tax=Malus domestica TaxID=3750 RepID=UPI0039770DAC